jgi:hypothetical protein
MNKKMFKFILKELIITMKVNIFKGSTSCKNNHNLFNTRINKFNAINTSTYSP